MSTRQNRIGKTAAAGQPQAKLVMDQAGSHGIVPTERDRVTRDLLAFLAS